MWSQVRYRSAWDGRGDSDWSSPYFILLPSPSSGGRVALAEEKKSPQGVFTTSTEAGWYIICMLLVVKQG